MTTGFAATDVYAVRTVGGPIDAIVRVPGSKSIANRALICATLADGESMLRNVPGGDDTTAMLECVALLGAGVGALDDVPTTVVVHGTGGALRPGPLTLHARLAGTTSRFVTALAALGVGPYHVDGLPPLRSRPMAPLHDALVALGAQVHPAEAWGHLPADVTGIDLAAAQGPAVVRIPGDISSQYITALMLIAPYLPGGLRIELTTPLVSRPYLAITSAVMAAFGVADVRIDDDVVIIAAGRYTARDYEIEPDASSASYPLAAAAVCGGRMRIPGLGADALQGDAAFADVLATMGCHVERTSAGTVVSRHRELVGVTLDMADLSDLVPTLAIIAPFAISPTEITGVGFIRAKESDRLGDLASELRRCGIAAVELVDGIRINPGVGTGARLGTHHDHRLAMAFGVLGLRLAGVEIEDPAVVSKSWPDFWPALESIGGSR
ncbi:MAG: 3-phosphoshikimate 1-carboxyvinyltransferase [Ilumatobacteraceae bacterium]